MRIRPFHLRRFLADRKGAVTVDFVVLTASVFILVVMAIRPVFDEADALLEDVGAAVGRLPVDVSWTGEGG